MTQFNSSHDEIKGILAWHHPVMYNFLLPGALFFVAMAAELEW